MGTGLVPFPYLLKKAHQKVSFSGACDPARTDDLRINSRLNKMYIAFTASIMSDFCGNNGRYGDNGIPFSTLSPHSTKFHASFRASIFCVFSEMRTNVIRKVAHMLYFFITCQKGRKPVWFPPRV